MAKPYNGHHCWNCWNVALWISNDENLYNLALYYKRKHKNLVLAAREMMRDLPKSTPDGAKYTLASLADALRGLE